MTSLRPENSPLDVIKKKMTLLKEGVDKYKDEYNQHIIEYQNETSLKKEAESQIPILNRRIQVLEQNLEQIDNKLTVTNNKLAETTEVVNNSERTRKTLENKINSDDRITILEIQLAEFMQIATEAKQKYNEVAQKMIITGVNLENTEEKDIKNNKQIEELQNELRLIDKNIKLLELSHERGISRQKIYSNQIETLEYELQLVESRAGTAERLTEKLRNEVYKLENELLLAKERNKHLSEKIETTIDDNEI